MSNVKVVPAPEPPVTRRSAGGSICPTCRHAAPGTRHVCITKGGSLNDIVLADDMRLEQLLEELLVHPAQPWAGGDRIRAVDRSWCFHQCAPPATEAGHGN